MEKELHSIPTEVAVEDGKVLLDGPGGIDLVMTPDAAIVTGERLIDGGLRAAGQERFKSLDHTPK
jgi:hypothetical protein